MKWSRRSEVEMVDVGVGVVICVGVVIIVVIVVGVVGANENESQPTILFFDPNLNYFFGRVRIFIFAVGART